MTSGILGRAISAVAAGILSLGLLAPTAGAATFVVDSTSDISANDGKTTLREAIAAAAVSGDTIEFSSSLFQGTLPARITLRSPLVVSKNLMLVGPGDVLATRAPKLQLDGLQPDGAKIRVLEVRASATLVVAGIAFQGGSAAGGGAVLIDAGATVTFLGCDFTNNTATGSGSGGAILNRGTLTLDQCLVQENSAANGGGVASEGQLTVVRSLIAANTATGFGGGIYLDGADLFSLESSSLSGNRGGTGGGLAFIASGGTLKRASIVAATFAHNTAEAQSGGLYVEGSAAVATVGGSLFAQNAIVNKGGAVSLHDLGNTKSGKINSADFNLFVKPGTTLSPWGPNDLIGADPRIGALAYNGGRTRTHALGAGSPALDRGDPKFLGSLVATDQRGLGFPRVAQPAGRVDIGAFEFGVSLYLGLLGDETITLPLGTPFVDPGVDLNGPQGTVLTTTVNGVAGAQIPPCCPGTYVIVYTATYAGASTSVTRTVIITESISLVAPASVTRFVDINTGIASVKLSSIVSVTGLPTTISCPVSYSVEVAPLPPDEGTQTGLTSLPTLFIGQTGLYSVTVKAFSQCGSEVGAVTFQLVIDPGNVVWPLAIDLDPKLLPVGSKLSGSIHQKIERAGESRWYKFQGKPGSRLEVALTQLKANLDLVVYSDINTAYNELLGLINSTPNNQALALLGAEFAPEAYAPEAYSPEAYAPEAYAPEAYAPEAYAPEAYAPEAYAPEAYAPEAYAPEAYAPEAYAPEAYAPEAYAPEAYAPEAYASAQQRSLIAFSASPGTVSEGVRFNTYSRTGEFYIRVRGQNGVYSPDALYTLTLSIQQDLCAGVKDLNVTPATFDASAVPPRLPNVPVGTTSLIVWDSYRIGLGRTQLEKTALADSLASFATAAKAVVLDVNSDARVSLLNEQADKNPACPIAKNLVAEAIRNLIQAYRKAAPTIADITLVGNDDVIPFFRTNDEALLASEANYFPPVQDATQSQSALRYGQILTQDRYGSSCQVVLATGPYDLPEIPTGRLVETAVEVTTYLNTYRLLFDGTVNTGGVLPTPKSAFVAGYDFLADSALSMRNDFAAGLGATGTVRSLIAPENAPPAFGWTADQLRTEFLLGPPPDLAYLAAHFSTGRLLAADYTTRLRAQDVAASGQDFEYALILSAGCHSGYSTVDPHALPLLTDQPDWAQAFSRKGAIWISGTGYQYGDTDFEEYTERLLLNVAQALRTAPTAAPVPVSIGQAIVDAKRKYLANTPVMRGIHEKTLLQVVLYGLPMVKLNLPGTRLIKPANNGAGDIGAVSEVAVGTPGRAQGLRTGTLSFKPTLTRENRTLDVVGTTNTVIASYFRGADGQVSIPGEPVRPLESFNVSRPEGLVRGVGFRGGLYTDLADFLPFTGAPATESRGVHGSFSTSVFYPIQPWNLNQIGVLCDGNGFAALNTFPTQFLSSGSDPAKGILRKYDQLQFTVFYCPATTEAALANPPAINVVASTMSAAGITFAIEAASTVGAGVQEVWITYTGLPGSPLHGRWQSFTLNAPANATTGIGTWTGTLAVTDTSAANLRFIVQAANGVGGVTASTNFGRYFVPGTSTLDGIGALGTPTTVTFDPAPQSGGFYRATIPLSARLVSGGVPLADKLIQFRLGPAIRSVKTDGQGVAVTNFLLNAQPGAYSLEANFGGDAIYQNASAVTPFTVAKMPTALTFPGDAIVTDVSRIVVTLKAEDGTPLKERTVVFILDNGSVKTAVSEITDGAGQARVPAGTLPASAAQTYQVSAYFAVPVTLPDGLTAVLSDPLYVGSTASSSVRLSAALTFKDEQAWVNYGDTTARGATAGNTGVTKAEILGAIAGPTSTFGPNSILATSSSTTVTARLRASLSGKVIADGLVILRVQSAGNRTWRGSATLNGTRVELNVDWNNTGGTGSYHVWIYPPAGSGPLYQALPALLNCELIFGVGSGEKPAGGTSEVGGPTKPWTQQTGSSRVRSN